MVTLVLVIPVFPIDDAAVCVLVLVLLLLLSTPADEEDVLVEERMFIITLSRATKLSHGIVIVPLL